LDEVKRLKEEKTNCQNQEERMILDEEYTKRLEEEICKKVEESLNTDDVKSEMKSIIEERCQNLINGVTLQLQRRNKTRFKKFTIRYLKKLNSI
jgi:arginine/glutamate-rich protein 1